MAHPTTKLSPHIEQIEDEEQILSSLVQPPQEIAASEGFLKFVVHGKLSVLS
jgi:hypothetical protein